MPFDSHPYPEVVYDQPHTVLTLGQSMIEVMGDGEKWCKGASHDAGHNHCIVGSIDMLFQDHCARVSAVERLLIHLGLTRAREIAVFNDYYVTTWADVRAKLINFV